LKFIAEQFDLITGSQKRYSTDTLIWSFMILLHSNPTYAAIRETEYLVLPNMKYLQSLCSSLACSADSENENKHYLRTRIKTLTERERFVVLQLDEIHIKEQFDYKGGEIRGCAENALEGSVVNEKSRATVTAPSVVPAKTVQSYLIASAFGHFKEIVALHPVKNASSDDLKEITQKVIRIVHQCGFHIIVIVSDNNKVNGSFFKLLNPSYDTTYFLYLNDSLPYKTFLMFDSVHLGKCIRNNWLNLKDKFKIFMIPNFENLDNKFLEARFNDLRLLYKKTANQLLKNT